jgi:hypothetical protein
MITVNGMAIAAGVGAMALAMLAYTTDLENASAQAEPIEPVQETAVNAACERAVWPYIPQECLTDLRDTSATAVRSADG